ncbi:MAG TPA: allophanate hydrolase [Jatrophihabitans sp.]|jgi:allophanate hydrolase
MGEVVDRALRALDAARRGPAEIWIELRDEVDVVMSAADVERRLDAGEHVPLAAMTVAVKDNIDVAGVPTTAGCVAYAYLPDTDAPAVAGLTAAGAVVIGKTNLDQFATGLVGTRSPHGVVRNSVDRRYVSGGSSSGSAVAVALGQVDVALGTDTAGSGRVPAAFNGIVGLKPTRGLISTHGVVPACASLDCVSVFATTVAAAHAAAAAAASGKWHGAFGDPFRRQPPAVTPLTIESVGVPDADELELTDAYRALWEGTVSALREAGVRLVPLALSELMEAGSLLYNGGLVAERYAAVGDFIEKHPDDVDPTVRAIIVGAAEVPAYRLAADLDRLEELRSGVAVQFRQFDAFLLPTAPLHPTIDEVAADPIGLNQRLGIYNNFCNLLDLSALTLPAGRTTAGLPFGVTCYAPAFADAALAGFGHAFMGESASPYPESLPPLGQADARREVAVVGAHLRGQPLNGQLVRLGARFVTQTRTAPKYRLYALPSEPAKPGLVSATAGEGVAVEIEIWSMNDAAFAELTATTLPPLAIGQVETAEGRTLPGFLCQAGPLLLSSP